MGGRGPVQAFVALGANLGDAQAAVLRACEQLGQWPSVAVLRRSALYRTAPYLASGPDFINAVVELVTTLSAPDLWNVLQKIEQSAGRERPYPNAPRTLDLDLLLYGSGRIDSAFLTVPHPRMWQRAFVLRPLADVAAQLVPRAALEAVREQAITQLET